MLTVERKPLWFDKYLSVFKHVPLACLWPKKSVVKQAKQAYNNIYTCNINKPDFDCALSMTMSGPKALQVRGVIKYLSLQTFNKLACHVAKISVVHVSKTDFQKIHLLKISAPDFGCAFLMLLATRKLLQVSGLSKLLSVQTQYKLACYMTKNQCFSSKQNTLKRNKFS